MTRAHSSEAGTAASPANDETINKGLHGLEEKNLVDRAPCGYSTAFEYIWRSHAKQILRVTQRITKNREDAEDALQESFLRAYIHLHDFDGRSSVATWLTRIAINAALMILRKRSLAPQLSLDAAGEDARYPGPVDVVDGNPSPEASYEQREREEILREGICALRPRNRQAVEVQILRGHSVKETAATMGLSITATKSRLFHAKAALRKSLEPKIGRRSPEATQLQLSPA